jgi:CheY-like chemotaxis protein
MIHTNVTHILVIEDNPSDVELLRLALDTAGLRYRMTTMHDGGDALALFRGEATADAPDLLILDLNLPKSDGLEILQAARSNPAFAELPVLVLSSASSPRELSKLLAFGRVRFQTKPSDLDRYLKLGDFVKEFLASLT